MITTEAFEFKGLRFKNRITTASGCWGYGEEYADFYDISRLGGAFTKAVSLTPKLGNKPPRMAETPAGMMNSIGLENPGVDVFIAKKIPFMRQFDTVHIVNVVGEEVAHYTGVIEKIEAEAPEGVDGYELNVSCPNVSEGGLAFGTSCPNTFNLTKACRAMTDKPLIVKLSPNVTDITEVAAAALDGGADGLSLINTFLGMCIDVETGESRIFRDYGGISGRAIRPMAVRMVHQVRSKFPDVPIIGQGGIYDLTDALEFLIAGADLLSLGTINFIDPLRPIEIIEGLKKRIAEKPIPDYKPH